MNSEVSIVVPAFNEEEWLPRTLDALNRARGILQEDFEVVVVDNESTDGTAELARGKGAKVVSEAVRQIARVRNRGAEATEGSYLIFVDADTVVEAETLRQALEAMRSGSICAGGARLTGDRDWKGFSAFLVWLWGWVSRRQKLPAGSFLFCTREAFEAAGGFEEKVFAGEEIWLARRLKRWGRSQGQGFLLLDDPPVVTSVRKGELFSSWQLLAQFVLLMVCPWVAWSRRLCWIWYSR